MQLWCLLLLLKVNFVSVVVTVSSTLAMSYPCSCYCLHHQQIMLLHFALQAIFSVEDYVIAHMAVIASVRHLKPVFVGTFLTAGWLLPLCQYCLLLLLAIFLPFACFLLLLLQVDCSFLYIILSSVALLLQITVLLPMAITDSVRDGCCVAIFCDHQLIIAILSMLVAAGSCCLLLQADCCCCCCWWLLLLLLMVAVVAADCCCHSCHWLIISFLIFSPLQLLDRSLCWCPHTISQSLCQCWLQLLFFMTPGWFVANFSNELLLFQMAFDFVKTSCFPMWWMQTSINSGHRLSGSLPDKHWQCLPLWNHDISVNYIVIWYFLISRWMYLNS